MARSAAGPPPNSARRAASASALAPAIARACDSSALRPKTPHKPPKPPSTPANMEPAQRERCTAVLAWLMQQAEVPSDASKVDVDAFSTPAAFAAAIRSLCGATPLRTAFEGAWAQSMDLSSFAAAPAAPAAPLTEDASPAAAVAGVKRGRPRKPAVRPDTAGDDADDEDDAGGGGGGGGGRGSRQRRRSTRMVEADVDAMTAPAAKRARGGAGAAATAAAAGTGGGGAAASTTTTAAAPPVHSAASSANVLVVPGDRSRPPPINNPRVGASAPAPRWCVMAGVRDTLGWAHQNEPSQPHAAAMDSYYTSMSDTHMTPRQTLQRG